MKFTLALCQIKGSFDKDISKARAEAAVKEAAAKAQVVSLPEMWNCPYVSKYFREYSEPEGGETFRFLSRLAKENDVLLVGGSIPEIDNDKVYNTSYVFDRQGNLIGKHRKAHLFDVDIKGGIRFMESETLSPGNSATVIDTEYGKMGVAICFDVRFPDLFRKMTEMGAKFVILPAAFSKKTGEDHWEFSLRGRALDNQIYLAAASPARDPESPYICYGYSRIIDPWGRVLATADTDEAIVYGEIDLEYVDDVRNQLPILKNRRPELYK
jgi:omega-amidase